MIPDSNEELSYRVETLERAIDSLKATVNAVKLDLNERIKSNSTIVPGIATKVAFDEKGLILKGSKLEPSDLPNINIESVIGLKDILDKILSTSDLEKLRNELKSEIKTKSNLPTLTGTKVNVDDNGFVTDVLDLDLSDIPDIPIEKVTGLQDKLDLLESVKSSPVESTSDVNYVSAGVHTKITYDNTGRIVSGEDLTLADIPIELIGRINILENKIVSLAQSSIVDNLSKEVSKKLNANDEYVKPGTYTKLKVDSNGLVVRGDKLSIEDLPDITVTDIEGLDSILKNKANTDDIISLNDVVSTVVSSLDKVGDISKLKSELETKAKDSELKDLKNDVTHLKSLMNTLNDKLPNDMILEQLETIQTSLSNIEGRLDVLEHKFDDKD